MLATREAMLSSVRRRPSHTRVSTADRYLHSMDACFRGLDCPEGLVGGLTVGAWNGELSKAESKFVYCDDSVALVAPPAGPKIDSMADGRTLPAGTILEFEAVITTTRRDRDGDVLESAGALIDPSAALLWQHIPFQPIGRLIEVTEHTSERVKARLAIADTDLGRDAATLASFGAVKISHGFEPRVFEPLPDGGWHIKRFEILEISLVSIPSNRDAVITAYSRRSLKSNLVRDWARTYFDERPARAPGMGRQAGTRKRAGSIRPRPAADATVVATCGCAQPGPDRTRGDWLSADCRTFVSRASLAEPQDVSILREARCALDRLIEHLAPDPEAR